MIADHFWTPPSLARSLLRFVTIENPVCIADVAVGDGRLLTCALEKWPAAEVLATDIDRRLVGVLKRTQPTWKVGKADFLRRRSVAHCSALRENVGKIALVLMNPPFSCRGASRVHAELDGIDVECSPAVAFVVSAAAFLSPYGQVIAILPAGCVTSDRDRAAWRVLRSRGSVRIVARHPKGTFAECSPRTVVLHFELNGASSRRRRARAPRAGADRRREAKGTVELVRGTLQMHAASESKSKAAPVLIHTTSLRGRRLDLARTIRTDSGRWSTSGPAVLLPRVGEPSVEKVVLVRETRRFVLSDCVLALRTGKPKEAEALYRKLIVEWDALGRLYQGTGARFVTCRRLTRFLGRVGFHVAVRTT